MRGKTFFVSSLILATSLMPVVSAQAQPIPVNPGGTIRSSRVDAPPVPPPPPTSYTVQPNDTLSAISTATGVAMADLVSNNGIPEPDYILPGQVLTLHSVNPVAAPRPPARPVATPTPQVRPSTNTAQDQAPTVQKSVPQADTSSNSGSTNYSNSSSFEQCVIQRESNGDAQVTNSSGHYGLYQFSYSTWVANGGSASDFGNASPSEQHNVFVHSAPSNWTPYDSCQP